MYIKQVVIQGFRSYRDQTIIDPFSAKHNVVVGRNGSGKSNFFLAIQFVLSDEFSHMRQEERQQLLHEGTGPRVVSAYVEITFDNTDNRIPIDKDEITLRRVIGSKKDQYFLDKKNVTKHDVMNLLESAGFSRSNPYYIVKQGKINQLATAKDSERLKLLREVAGTRVYDERKTESQNILNDTESKCEKIDDLLKYIEERLGTLETEKEELKQYQKWDKERRCLEYTIHDKELRDTREKLDQLDSSRQNESERASELLQQAQEASDKVENITQDIKEVNDQSSLLKDEKQQIDEERQQLMKQKTKLELDVKDLEEGIKDEDNLQREGAQDLKKIEDKIEKRENELNTILPLFKAKRSIEEDCQTRLESCEQRRTDLYSKQGRGSQFTSKDDRDNWIKKELNSLKSSVAHKEKQIQRYKVDIEDTRKTFDQITRDITERSENLETRKSEMEKATKSNAELNIQKNDLSNKRKDLWRQEHVLEAAIQTTKEDLKKAENNLRYSMSKAVADGIESVKRVVQEKNIKGVYGPLIENFTCGERFFTAIDVVGGGKLFNIIVDNDKTGSTVLSHINRMKLRGEVTFMPLNRLNFTDVKYPTSPDVLPMISKVEYDDIFKPAMQLAFGKTLIGRSQDICSQFSKSHDLDAVTLDGEKFSRRGTLEGGFNAENQSRLGFQKKIWEKQEKLEKEEQELITLKNQINDIDGQLTRIKNELQNSETTKDQLRKTYERQKEDIHRLNKQKISAEERLGPRQTSLANYETELERLKNQMKSFQEELGSELLSQLSREDQGEVETLNREIVDLKDKLKVILSERTELEGEKQKLEDLLKKNLYKQRDELKMNLEEVGIENKSEQLEIRRGELETCSGTLEKYSSRFKELTISLTELKEKIKKLEKKLEDWKAKEKEKKNTIDEDSRLMDKIATKRSLYLKKKEDCMKKIRELGSLPADAFEKYQKTATKALWKKLKEANEELKKYSHVNKKALDQFVNFSDQKEKLIKRKVDLTKGHESILDLMDVLEQRKHEAILFTFKQVSHNFTDCFKQLVHGGKAQLIMKKEKRDQQTDTEEDSQSQSESSSSQRSMKSFDEFTGISIKVSFSGKSAETLEMNQLSGGQKTLVALTLIFAIQKCDPAPFYLFDEIDQALDPMYRKTVATMIHNLSDKAQFITTTFRSELLESAEKFYGVQFKNKVSHILSITKEDAKDFVQDDVSDKTQAPKES